MWMCLDGVYLSFCLFAICHEMINVACINPYFPLNLCYMDLGYGCVGYGSYGCMSRWCTHQYSWIEYTETLQKSRRRVQGCVLYNSMCECSINAI